MGQWASAPMGQELPARGYRTLARRPTGPLAH